MCCLQVLLEAAAEVLAGVPRPKELLREACGVYMGISWTEYSRIAEAHGTAVGAYTAQAGACSCL